MTELTNAEKRVQVARDVIEQLNAQTLISNPGLYMYGLDLGLVDEEITGDTQIKTILDAQPACQVCALGACFVSMMRRYNECTAENLVGDDDDAWGDSPYVYKVAQYMGSVRSMSAYLNRLFSEDQLKLIETAYEGVECAGTTGEVYDIPEDSPLLGAHEFHMARARYDCERVVYYSHNEIELEVGDSRADDGNVILKDIMKNIICNKGEFKP